MLADRAAVLDDLTRRALGTPRLLLFLLAVALLQLGWGCVGAGLVTMGPGFDPVSLVFLAVGGVTGIAVLVPTVFAVAFGVRRDSRMRELLCQWAALAHTPVRDAGFRKPVLSVAWLLVSSCSAPSASGSPSRPRPPPARAAPRTARSPTSWARARSCG